VLSFLLISSCSFLKQTNKEIIMGVDNISGVLKGDKPVQTSVLFNNVNQKVVVLKIQEGDTLKEHLSKVPALLVCVSGVAVYKEKDGKEIEMKVGDYVEIPQDVLHEVVAIKLSDFLLIK
jgi:quercetin dioxygenase-like cupin family protein